MGLERVEKDVCVFVLFEVRGALILGRFSEVCLST